MAASQPELFKDSPVMNPTFSLGKYRELLLAIVLFLVIDLGVLVFNIVASHEIERDASEINMAGELRMVSQQLAKSLLTLEDEVRSGAQTQTSLAQILEASDEFDQALAALNASQPGLFARIVDDGEARKERQRLLGALAGEWQPLGRDVRRMLARKDTLAVADVTPVSNKSVSRNLKLLQLSDDLTLQMEDISREKTSGIRTIQMGAITLALLNFVFIVFKFLRKLSASDRRAEIARNETRQILDTVHQGLFLLLPDGRIGGQRSASLTTLFGCDIGPRANLMNDVLTPLINDSALLETADGYIATLFDRKIRPSLLEKLNPLVEVEIDTPSDPRQKKKYINFAFEQVRQGDQVGALLVSVIDVTQEVLLQRELSGVEARAKSEIEMLIAVIDQDPALVQEFIKGARQRIEAINHALQNVRADSAHVMAVVDQTAASIHGIKGEAALLGIQIIEQHVHELEDRLAALRQSGAPSGEDLIGVAVGIGDLLEKIDGVEAVASRLARLPAYHAEPQAEAQPLRASDPLTPVVEVLKQLGKKVANDLGKEVFFEVDFPPVRTVPEQLTRICREALPQLVRNAVVHGIEAKDERQRHGKQPVGQVLIRFEFEGAAGYRIRVRDDGAGLSLARLREQAVASGEYSELDVRRMQDHQLVSMLFEPGFTTLDSVNLHAGRGDGLAVVRDVVRTLGAHLRVLSAPSLYTEFIISNRA